MPIESSKVAIIYCSVHHKNTERLIRAISKKYPDVLLVDAAKAVLINLESYKLIGVASGIFYGKMHKSLLKFLENNLQAHRKVFIMYTSGAENENYGKEVESIIREKNCTYLGKYSCRGYDTFGPFKLIGGIQKNHPTEIEINDAVRFFENIINSPKI